MTPLERAARALFDMDSGLRSVEGKETNWFRADQLDREKYVKEARAVLTAIRDAFDESGMVEGARQMAELEGSESATRASRIYDEVIDWFDALLAEEG